MEPITEGQAMAYEAGSTSFISSIFYDWFPKYFYKARVRRYKRYLGFIDYEERNRKAKEAFEKTLTDYFKR